MNPPNEKYTVDLHLHTNYSDGMYTPQKLIALAATTGMSTIAITDHDSVAGLPEGAIAAKECGIELINGCEISCTELEKEYHILAYHFDPQNTFFTEKLTEFKQMRIERAIKICEKLQELNVTVDIKDLLYNTKSAALTRMHIAKEIVKKGYVDSTRDAFTKYLYDNGPAYEPKFDFSVAEAVKMIHSAGGVASLAHPGRRTSSREIYKFVSAGLDGIEVVHPEHNPSLQKKYETIAKQYNLLQTGGSDFHGSRDWERYVFGSYTIDSSNVAALKQRALRYR
jgi:3',5'-nucleoside bisphosphate phosphatase